jgi:hypothetical protein
MQHDANGKQPVGFFSVRGIGDAWNRWVFTGLFAGQPSGPAPFQRSGSGTPVKRTADAYFEPLSSFFAFLSVAFVSPASFLDVGMAGLAGLAGLAGVADAAPGFAGVAGLAGLAGVAGVAWPRALPAKAAQMSVATSRFMCSSKSVSVMARRRDWRL